MMCFVVFCNCTLLSVYTRNYYVGHFLFSESEVTVSALIVKGACIKFYKHLIDYIIAGEMWRHLWASKDYGNYRRNNTIILLLGHLSRVVHLPLCQITCFHGQTHPLKHCFVHLGLGLSQVATHWEPHLVHTRPPSHSVNTISHNDV